MAVVAVASLSPLGACISAPVASWIAFRLTPLAPMIAPSFFASTGTIDLTKSTGSLGTSATTVVVAAAEDDAVLLVEVAMEEVAAAVELAEVAEEEVAAEEDD